jgi:hypothetical protein
MKEQEGKYQIYELLLTERFAMVLGDKPHFGLEKVSMLHCIKRT